MHTAVASPLEILYGHGVALACDPDGGVSAEQLHGLFAGDTRVLSTYRLTIADDTWRVLARTRPSPSVAQWDAQNPRIRTATGELAEGTVHLRVRRRVSGALHDDLTICAYVPEPILVRIALQLDADFADLFEVKDRSTAPRLAVIRIPHPDGISFEYRRGDFQRALHVAVSTSDGKLSWVGSRLIFDLRLMPGSEWRCCVHAEPEIDGRRSEFVGDPHADDAPIGGVTLDAAALLQAPFERGRDDLASLAIEDRSGGRFIAAGAPWFLALFGRDALVTGLMTPLLGADRGALAVLGRVQARARDDYRDAEPGKIAHELRHGELARFGVVPHSPYYGTHDAPELYVLALWQAFRWTGDRTLLDRHLGAARAAMAWCDEHGDLDGDGLLEYRTRSTRGYLNQGWKDAGDAVPHVDGRLAIPPVATVELQAYWFAARHAFAELLDAVGETAAAAHQREAARQLRARIEARFWMEDAGTYALALDGEKAMVRSIASNAGHVLWCGVPSVERARRVAARLLADDMSSGYGLRTLSATHRRYNPLSYQLGSVWPHDTALCAAGLARYGMHDEASRLVRAILDAAVVFELARLPELFCGFPRAQGLPVPYEKANSPQAWAAAAPVLAAHLFLGLVADVPHRRCYLSPWLPAWLPSLSLTGIPLGDGTLDVAIVHTETGTVVERVAHASLEILVGPPPPAPLWGAPLTS